MLTLILKTIAIVPYQCLLIRLQSNIFAFLFGGGELHCWLIDFLAVSLLSLLLGSSAIAIIIVFLIGWVGLRVVWVTRNRGQSLGRWALDMRIIDLQRGGTPDLLSLTKREGVIGLGAALLLIGLVNLSPGAPWALLLFVPIALDLS